MLDDATLRVVLVAVAAVGVVVFARTSRGTARRRQDVDLTGLGLPPGIVLFSSTDCPSCASVRTLMAVVGAKPREVTWELEPGLFARAGVTEVPLTVLVDAEGTVLDQWSGIPTRTWMSSAADRASQLTGE